METLLPKQLTVNGFSYEIIKETEKAVFAKVPYWEATSDYKKKHKQRFCECWIPKAVIEKGVAKDFVIGKKNEIRLKNAYQRAMYNMPECWRTMGEYAPVKTKIIVNEIDYKKLELLRAELMAKYGVKDYDNGFFINPADNITDEIENLARIYRNPESHIDSPALPRIDVTYYRVIK